MDYIYNVITTILAYLNLSLITLVFFTNIIVMLGLGIWAKKNKTMVPINAKYSLFSGLLVLLFILYLRTNLWVLPSFTYSIGYSVTLTLVLLFWAYLFTLNLFLRVERMFIESNKPEFVTVMLLSRLEQKKFIYKLLKVDPQTYYNLFIGVTILAPLESTLFGQAFIWITILGIYMIQINLRQNVIILLENFNLKYSVNNSDDYYIIENNLKGIYLSGGSGSWTELFEKIYKHVPSSGTSKIPKGWGFPQGTPSKIMVGSCIFASIGVVGVLGGTYNSYLKAVEVTKQSVETTKQSVETTKQLVETTKQKQIELEIIKETKK